MPQPLRKWVPSLDFSPATVEQRPDLATCIARVSTQWVQIETALGLLLAVTLDTNARSGVAMYLSLVSSQAQEAAMLAALEARTSTEIQAEFAGMLKDIRARSRERNKVVHALWGVTPEYPDALINCPPSNLVRDVASAMELYYLLMYQGEPSPEFVSNLRVYRRPDFEAIWRRLEATEATLGTFTRKVGDFHVRRHALARALVLPPEEAEEVPAPHTSQTNPKEPT
jgi:hypothetical protein